MRAFLEPSGFDLSLSWGKQALRRAEVGSEKTLEHLPDIVVGLAGRGLVGE